MILKASRDNATESARRSLSPPSISNRSARSFNSLTVRAWGDENCPQLSVALTGPRLRALHRAEDIGSALKGGVNVCQRQLVNEVLGPLVTEFVRNFGREDATPIQRGSNASLLGRVQAIKLISHRRSDFYPEAQIRQMAVQKSAGCCPKNASQTIVQL
jgi:hypothetical protein